MSEQPQNQEAKRQVTLSEAVRESVEVYGFKQHTAIDSEGRRRKFRGSLLVSISGRWNQGRQLTRWTDRELYQLENGKFLEKISHITCWQGESDTYSIRIYDTLDDVVKSAEPDLLEDLRKELQSDLHVIIPVSDIAIPLE